MGLGGQVRSKALQGGHPCLTGQAQSGAPGPLLLFLSTIVGSLHGLF